MIRRSTIRFIRRLGGKILYLLSFFDHIFANQKMMIYQPSVGETFNDVNLCVYVTYNESILSDNSRKLLCDARSLGFTTIHINNTSKVRQRRVTLGGLSFDRKNAGYDLAAVRDALVMIQVQPKSLLIINSSVHYLSNGLIKLVDMAKETSFDVVGVTESFQKRTHLQSYFFFSQTNEGVEALSAEYRRMRNWVSKRAAVNFGELRMMKNIALRKVTVGAVVSYEEILLNALKNPKLVDRFVFSDIKKGVKVNPTQHLWQVLFFMEIPIVKKSLIRDNPANLEFRPLDYLNAESIYRETNRN